VPWTLRWSQLAVAAICALLVLVTACGDAVAVSKSTKVKSAVTHAYATLFDFADPSVTAKTAVIQDGSTLQMALTQALSSSFAAEAAGAKVIAVNELSPTGCRRAHVASPCAKVTYNVLSPQQMPLFPSSSTGYAVEVHNRWLVTKSTICSLLGLFYSVSGQQGSPPGC
jgi:hypothetical protein